MGVCLPSPISMVLPPQAGRGQGDTRAGERAQDGARRWGCRCGAHFPAIIPEQAFSWR